MSKYFDLSFVVVGLASGVMTGILVLWLGWPAIVLGALSILMAGRRE